jgi:hypothetical protein
MSSVSLGSLLKGKADQLDKLRTDWWEDDAVYDKQLSGLHDKDMNVPHDDKKIAEVRAKRKELEKEFSKQAVETVHDTVPMLEEAIRRMSYAANSKDYTELRLFKDIIEDKFKEFSVTYEGEHAKYLRELSDRLRLFPDPT